MQQSFLVDGNDVLFHKAPDFAVIELKIYATINSLCAM